MIATLTISVPKPVEDWLDTQAQNGGYESANDYVKDLILRDRDRIAAIAQLQCLIDEGLASGISDRTHEEILAEAPLRAGVTTDDL